MMEKEKTFVGNDEIKDEIHSPVANEEEKKIDVRTSTAESRTLLSRRSDRPTRRAASIKRIISEDSESGQKQNDQQTGVKRKAPSSGRKKDDIWVQCDKCQKWRCLPNNYDLKKLTAKKKWDCTMNPDSTRNTCEAPEEEYKTTKRDEATRAYVDRWMRRIELTDECEQKLPKEILRSKIRPANETEWIRCSNPLCGKWRAVSPLVDAKTLKRRGVWYCVLNNWDPHQASCLAAQQFPEHHD